VRAIGIGRYGSSVSAARRIRIVPRAVFPPFELVQPLAFDKIRIGSQVTYEWQPVEGALEYHLQATTSSAFDRPDIDTVISGRQVTAKLPPQAPFLQWRVQARSAAGVGAWSDTVRIALQSDAPEELLPVEPTFGRLGVAVNGLFEIVRTDPEGSVVIEASTDPYFDEGVLVFTVSQSTAVYSGLPAGRIVYWRAAKKVSDYEKLFGPGSILVTDRTTSVRSYADVDGLELAFDRSSQTLFCVSCETGIEAVSAYDILGKAISVETLEIGSRWGIVRPPAEGATLVLLAVRLTGSSSPRFMVVTI